MTVAPAGTSATTTAPIPMTAPSPTAMWSRISAPRPIVTSEPMRAPPPMTAPGPTWTYAPIRTSCSTTARELTMAWAPTRAPALTMAPARITVPSASSALGETHAVEWTTTAQRAHAARPSMDAVTRRRAPGSPTPPTASTTCGRSPDLAPSRPARPIASSPRCRVADSAAVPGWPSGSVNPRTCHPAGSVPAASKTTPACSPPPIRTSGRRVTIRAGWAASWAGWTGAMRR